MMFLLFLDPSLLIGQLEPGGASGDVVNISKIMIIDITQLFLEGSGSVPYVPSRLFPKFSEIQLMMNTIQDVPGIMQHVCMLEPDSVFCEKRIVTLKYFLLLFLLLQFVSYIFFDGVQSEKLEAWLVLSG